MSLEQIASPEQLAIEESSPATFCDVVDHLAPRHGPGWPDHFGRAVAAWADSASTGIATLSLFTGAGGLDLGVHDAGFRVHTMVEIEKAYAATLAANAGNAGSPLGDVEVVCRDIRDFAGDGLPEIGFIVGGPPCQTFSAAGRRSHGVPGTDDPRGVLFEEYIRLLERLRPRAFLFENVYGIVGAQGGRPWELIVKGFAAAGYKLYWRILDAADYGVPQHRERLFIVGIRRDLDVEFAFPRPTHGPDSISSRPHYSAGAAIADLAAEELDGPDRVGGRYGHLLEEIPPGLNYSYFTAKLGHPRPVFAWRSKFSDFLYKADPEMPVRTIKAQGGQFTGPFHWENRPFTIAELKRLQTFPDSFQLVGTRLRAIEQIGNSVPPQIARLLALAILEQVFERPPPAALPKVEPDEKLSFRTLKRQRTEMYKAKARESIAALGEPDPPGTGSKRVYRADVTDDFTLIETESGALEITEDLSRESWIFQASAGEDRQSEFTIELKPREGGWSLPGSRVELRGQELRPHVFTVLWKALERRIALERVAADLVQLNGYYQYKPQLTAAMTLQAKNQSDEWRVVASVVSGHGVRSPANKETLSFIWGIPPEDVDPLCRFLRSLGFEVRNAKTNPQIPADHFLVPYAFPTLNARSVQLRKCV